MDKRNSYKRRLKYVFLAFACAASFSLTGLASACAKDEDKEDDKTTSVEDTQLLKNGNFEFFNVPDEKAEYLIKTPLNWTRGGDSSYTMSGIIGTSATAWGKLSDPALAETLDKNNDLDSSAEDYEDKYIDYNGMHSYDILYKNSYDAIKVDKVEEDDKDWSDDRRAHAKDLLDNPGTHYNVNKDTLTCADGSKVYENEDGDWFLDEDFKKPISNVLMVHNFAENHNGVAQKYSSQKVDLPANTAAEISFWVKTAELKYDKGLKVEQDFGANVTITHTAGSTTLDDFKITSINTEKLIDNGAKNSNGWIEYTVYVNACDFANTSVSIELGLGETGYLTEGYAFFDDVTVTRYPTLDDVSSYDEAKLTVNGVTASCNLSSTKDEKVFKADSYERNNGSFKQDNFSKNFYYRLDLASTESYKDVSLAGAKAGLTVDENGFATSLTNPSMSGIGVTSVANAKLPKDFTALITSEDTIACVNPSDSMFPTLPQRENKELSSILKSANGLPSADDDTKVLAIYSAFGAAYTANLGDVEIPANGYRIVSFWLKTSSVGADSTANVKLYATSDKDTSASLAVNTKDVTVDIDDDNKDIYDGWVQCFFFVHNDTDKANHYTMELSFGNSEIKDTSVIDYKNGWIALANLRQLDVDEDVFGYTGSGTYAATLTLDVEEESYNKVFDEVYGSQSNSIKDGIVNPNAYTGVNGGSSSVVHNETVSLPFDDLNTNKNAGLINKKYFENYSQSGWYKTLLECFNVNSSSAITATDAWNKIFGNSSYQPLVIINDGLRDSYVKTQSATESNYKDGTFFVYNEQTGKYEHPTGSFDKKQTYYSLKQVFNYGFISNENTIAADSYTAVSVRVKVSRGATAYVYLTDSKGSKNVLGFNAPKYSYLYDKDGNVIEKELDKNATLAEQRANIVYKVRGDGLYEDKDGKLFANVYNYNRLYKDASKVYYDGEGNEVSFDDLENNVIYYSDAAHTTQANCYLTATDGTRVYEVYNGDYYYLVNGKRADKVNAFETKYARYDYSSVGAEYYAVIDGNEEGVADNWITVTFAIHTGSESKNYRLELWSGSRESTGVNENGEITGNASKSAVIFDYSYYTVTEDTYDTLRSEYETRIKNEYLKILADNDLLENIKSTNENLTYYKNLVEGYIAEGKLNESVLGSVEEYVAHYYAFSLYDSAQYIPFNENTAKDGETGYNYDIANFKETLAYLSVKDGDNITIFADYTTVNQSVERTTVDDEDEDEDKEDTGDGNIWLLVSSIILVVVLLFAIAAIFIKDAVKKRRRNKTQSKNAYQQRNRYIRKLRIQKENIEEIDPDEVKTENEEPAAESVDEPAPQESANESADNAAEQTPAEEATVDSSDEANGEEIVPAEENFEKETTDEQFSNENYSVNEPETVRDEDKKDGE